MWKTVFTDEYKRRHRKFEKKRRKELEAVLLNLRRYFESLEQGTPPKQIQGGWIHAEPMDVVAIDQRGGGKKEGGKNLGKGLIETRLYVYCDCGTETLHAIILGDKSTQTSDIIHSKKYVQSLRNNRLRND